MALIEFVDFNEVYVSGTKPEAAKSTEKKKKTRRSSKKTKADGSPEDSAATESA